MNKTDIKQLLIEQLGDSSTALVCNAYDHVGLHAPFAGSDVKCFSPELPVLVGEAITLKLEAGTPDAKPDNSPYYDMLTLAGKTPVQKVIVIQTVGDPKRSCIMGDGMAKAMLSAGAVGLITDGGIRDVDDILNQGFKVFASGCVVNHYALRFSALGEPVVIDGLEIKTGDLIHADKDGIITVPEAGWRKVVLACRLTLEFEKKAHVIMRQKGIPVMGKKQEITKLVKETAEKLRQSGDFEI